MKRYFQAAVWVCSLLLTFILGTQPLLAVASTPAPADAAVYLIEPVDGATVPSHFTAQFGLSGMGVAPAGIEKDNTGHHHLLIDLNRLPNLNEPLAATEQIKHFGGGQTETELTLPPGQHTLQLVLGNYAHVPHNKPVLSKKITITVVSSKE
ncbi:MAG: DUF4399 domain-containing protein [Thermosynechococcaceae cyanobacterium]